MRNKNQSSQRESDRDRESESDPIRVANVVNHPSHYTSHPSGVECIEITEWFSFNLGNAIKYIWRADVKEGGSGGTVDLEKAIWYLRREVEKRHGKEMRAGAGARARAGERE